MSEVTRILSAIEQGDPSASEQLLPLVYHELRQLAAQKREHEKRALPLVAKTMGHEAFQRRVDPDQAVRWNRPGRLFAPAAEAMRSIPIGIGRRKQCVRDGGGR